MTQKRQTNGNPNSEGSLAALPVTRRRAARCPRVSDATRRSPWVPLKVAALAIAAVGLALLGLASPARADHTWEVTMTVNGRPTFHRAGDPAWERTINMAGMWDGPHLDWALPAPFPNNYYPAGQVLQFRVTAFGPPDTWVSVTWKTTKSLKNLGCKWVLVGTRGLDLQKATLTPYEDLNQLYASVPIRKMQIADLDLLFKAVGGHFFGPQCEGLKGIMHKASAALHYNLSPGKAYVVVWQWSKSGWQKLADTVGDDRTLIGGGTFRESMSGLYRLYARADQDKAKGTTRYFCVGDPRQCEASMKQAKDPALSEAIKQLGPVAPLKK